MISVVIPMYNSKDTILNCIDSVLNQSAISFIDEILVVNDGSTDGCDELVKSHYKEQALVKVYDKENGGVSSARNLGMKNCRGEWIALLDSDDQWDKDKIKKQVEIITRGHNIWAIGTGRIQDNAVVGHKYTDDVYYMTVKDCLKKYWPHTSSYLIKREILNKIGYFSENRSYGEDGQFFLKIAEIYPIYYLIEPLISCGDGKPTFGYSGLSSNLKGMHEGCLNNVRECYERRSINFIDFLMFSLWEDIKYVRRKFIARKYKK